jgi:hypothetical protein
MAARKTRIRKGRTVGVKPAVPAVAVAWLVTFLIDRFGVDLTDPVMVAVAGVLSAAAAALAGPGEVESRA